ncbi:SRPBCC family protein [Actinoplanes sp. HUAS TT8]|uniref:SRPBCC family protein n=1 Tax=Actinoplanes sp. HUAS TT8 TaxID=3447453 RepID=UPI003F5270C8
MRYEVTVPIDAPIELIWRLTVHVEDWPAFLPTVRRLDRLETGEIRVGSTARLKQPGQASAVWTVTRLEPQREFTWETRRPGLRLTGRHLLETDGGGTRMTLVLEVDGPLSGVASALIGGMMRASLRREADGFARRALAESG